MRTKQASVQDPDSNAEPSNATQDPERKRRQRVGVGPHAGQIKNKTMDIKAEEISKVIREQIGSFAVEVDVAEVGSVVSLGDGIARVHGVERAMAGEMLEFPHGVFGIALNLEEDRRGRRAARRVHRNQGRRHREADRPHHLGAGRRGTARPRRQRARPADRRQGPDHVKDLDADRAHRAGRRRSSAGARAAPDRAEGHRRHGAHRPRASAS